MREGIARQRVTPQRVHRVPIAARGASDSEVDASRMERRERAELFGNDERRVIGKHDAPGPDANVRGTARDMRDDDRRRGAGDAFHVVVLGQPEAFVAEALGVTGEVEAVAKRNARRRALGDVREVED